MFPCPECIDGRLLQLWQPVTRVRGTRYPVEVRIPCVPHYYSLLLTLTFLVTLLPPCNKFMSESWYQEQGHRWRL